MKKGSLFQKIPGIRSSHFKDFPLDEEVNAQELHWAHNSNPADGETKDSEFKKIYLKHMKDGTSL
jgi:hypothetical protein